MWYGGTFGRTTVRFLISCLPCGVTINRGRVCGSFCGLGFLLILHVIIVLFCDECFRQRIIRDYVLVLVIIVFHFLCFWRFFAFLLEVMVFADSLLVLLNRSLPSSIVTFFTLMIEIFEQLHFAFLLAGLAPLFFPGVPSFFPFSIDFFFVWVIFQLYCIISSF